jgi:hypothetical protein
MLHKNDYALYKPGQLVYKYDLRYIRTITTYIQTTYYYSFPKQFFLPCQFDQNQLDTLYKRPDTL